MQIWRAPFVHLANLVVFYIPMSMNEKTNKRTPVSAQWLLYSTIRRQNGSGVLGH
jgi:hypothetical protein